MLVGRLGDSLFAMPAPHGHGSTGIAEPRIVDYPMNLDGCLGDEVHHPSITPMLLQHFPDLLVPQRSSCGCYMVTQCSCSSKTVRYLVELCYSPL